MSIVCAINYKDSLLEQPKKTQFYSDLTPSECLWHRYAQLLITLYVCWGGGRLVPLNWCWGQFIGLGWAGIMLRELPPTCQGPIHCDSTWERPLECSVLSFGLGRAAWTGMRGFLYAISNSRGACVGGQHVLTLTRWVKAGYKKTYSQRGCLHAAKEHNSFWENLNIDHLVEPECPVTRAGQGKDNTK